MEFTKTIMLLLGIATLLIAEQTSANVLPLTIREAVTPPPTDFDFRRELALSPDVFLQWFVDLRGGIIQFTLQVNTVGWVGFGISNSGSKSNADIILGGVKDGAFYFDDAHFNPTGSLPIWDQQMDWYFIDGFEYDGVTLLEFWRYFNTGDTSEDVVIQDKFVDILWAYHPTSDSPYDISSRHSTTQRGLRRINLLDDGTTPDPTTENPTTEYLTTEYPTTESPTTEYRTTEYPTTESPTTEYRTTEYPTTEYRTTEYPTTEYRTTEYPTTEYRTTEYPTTETPTTEYRTTEYRTTEYRTTEYPTISTEGYTDPPGFWKELELSPDFYVQYSVDFSRSRIEFQIVVNATGWVGFGISTTRSKSLSDIIVGGVKDGQYYFNDCHFTSAGLMPSYDLEENWMYMNGMEINGLTIFDFWRDFDTGDRSGDIVIRDEYVDLIWAFHESSDYPYDISNRHSTAHRGVRRVNLLDRNTVSDFSRYSNSKYQFRAFSS